LSQWIKFQRAVNSSKSSSLSGGIAPVVVDDDGGGDRSAFNELVMEAFVVEFCLSKFFGLGGNGGGRLGCILGVSLPVVVVVVVDVSTTAVEHTVSLYA